MTSRSETNAYSNFGEFFDLTGKVAMVTGAGRGIGRAIAQAFAAQGAKVILCSRTEQELKTATKEITESGGEAIYFTLDVGNAAQVHDIVSMAASKWGCIDVLVNSAGGGCGRRSALEVSESDWDTVHMRNLKGLFFVTQAVGRHMLPRRSGSVINVSSVAGLRGRANAAVYGASKGGVDAITRMLAAEWGPLGVRVNSLAPGFVRTPFTEGLFRDETRLAGIVSQIPLGRCPDVEDVAAAAVFLASSASRNVTGIVLPIDGGRSIAS